MPKHGRLSFKGSGLVSSKKKKRILAEGKAESSSRSQVHVNAKACCAIVNLSRPVIRVRFRVIGLEFHWLLYFCFFGVFYF